MAPSTSARPLVVTKPRNRHLAEVADAAKLAPDDLGPPGYVAQVHSHSIITRLATRRSRNLLAIALRIGPGLHTRTRITPRDRGTAPANQSHQSSDGVFSGGTRSDQK